MKKPSTSQSPVSVETPYGKGRDIVGTAFLRLLYSAESTQPMPSCFVRHSFGTVAASWSLLSEEQRQAWCHRGKSKQTRRRLGKRWPLPGYNYYMRVNVVLANRGQPLLVLPPAEPWQPRT